MKGRFVAVVGPSGVGKDSVMQALSDADSRLKVARRVITRPQDAGGEDYDGVTQATFDTMAASGEFALWWNAHQMSYGIPKDIEKDLTAGVDVLANISRAMIQDMKNRFPENVVLSLHADREILRQRLTMRGREDAQEIADRLDRAKFEIPSGAGAIRIDNSGAFLATVTQALSALYPGSK